jgi:mRNA interferase MazF
VVGKPYIPDAGDLVWLEFNPQAGHKQGGRRPALILSPRAYNAKAGLALACPITNQAKGYPFEVAIPPGGTITGVILSDQVKSLDWRARNASFGHKAPVSVVIEVRERLRPLLGYS